VIETFGFLRLDEVRSHDRADAGGKAANLGEILSLGLRVPRGFVLPTRLWEGQPSIRAAAAKLPSDHPAQLNDILGSAFSDQLLRRFDELGVDLVAVRSSAVAEDSPEASFAGVFRSILGVARAGLAEAVLRCWKSRSSARARAYCQVKGLAPDALRMAVLVQELIEPTTSGVCFTCDPLTGRPTQMMIEAVYGFGDALVSGTITPDAYVYEREAKVIMSRAIVNQVRKVSLLSDSLTEVQVDPPAQDAQKLTDDQIHHLASSCGLIHDHFGAAQDIEFAFIDGRLTFLQTRPITGSRRED
jgi:pyruvate,water dikinase